MRIGEPSKSAASRRRFSTRRSSEKWSGSRRLATSANVGGATAVCAT
jgi:hypothetical protein